MGNTSSAQTTFEKFCSDVTIETTNNQDATFNEVEKSVEFLIRGLSTGEDNISISSWNSNNSKQILDVTVNVTDNLPFSESVTYTGFLHINWQSKQVSCGHGKLNGFVIQTKGANIVQPKTADSFIDHFQDDVEHTFNHTGQFTHFREVNTGCGPAVIVNHSSKSDKCKCRKNSYKKYEDSPNYNVKKNCRCSKCRKTRS